MKDALIKELRELISTDKLEEAIQRLVQFGDGQASFVHSNTVFSIAGQLARIEDDNSNNVISYDDYIIKRNQIRSSLVDLMDTIKSGKAVKAGSISTTKNENERELTDSIFLTLIIGLMLIGIGLFVYAALNKAAFEERLFQGGLSVASMSSSIWAYLRIKTIELAS